MGRRATQFKKGQSGNPKGRPKGARSKLSEAFLRDLFAQWEERGRKALQELAKNDPGQFARLVASVIPKSLNVSAEHSFSMEAASDSEVEQFLEGLFGEEASDEETVH